MADILDEHHNGEGDEDMESSALQTMQSHVKQLQLGNAQQQEQIDNLLKQHQAQLALIDKLSARVGILETSSANSNGSSTGPMKAFQPRSAPSGRRTLDPKSFSQMKSDNKVSAPPSSLQRRFRSREKLPIAHDELGTYKMYLKGRPVVFRLPEGYTPPTNPEPQEPPTKQLELEWAHGYRGKDCRNNIYVLGSDEIVFFSAAVCVIQNLESQTQRHYLEHTDDVKCLTLHPDGKTVASGQVAGHERSGGKAGRGSSPKSAPNPDYQPHIRIWDSETLQTLKTIGAGTFDRAVACVSFSVVDDGKFICAVDEHNDHRMSVWAWSKGPRGTKLAEMKSSQDPVFQADFNPTDSNSIVCCGKNQLSFWKIEGKNLIKQMALFGKAEKPKFVTCVTFNEFGDVFSGDSNGNILTWSNGSNKISKTVAAHEGVIFSLAYSNDQLVSAGGKDQTVKIWNVTENGLEASSEDKLSEEAGSARLVIKNNDQFIIGTTKNRILYGSSVSEAETIVEGHAGELWGLSELKYEEGRFITCSYDNHVKLWNVSDKKSTADIKLPESLHSICSHPTRPLIAVGCKTPNYYLYNIETNTQLSTGAVGTEQLEVAEFSPDGNMLALGSRDNHLYLFKLEDDNLTQIALLKGHTSFITQLDWTTDSKNIRTNSGDYEILYWQIESAKQLTDGDAIRNLEFASQNCVLSLDTVGMWPVGADGTDINGCTRNHASDLLASADDFGKVNLYQYPSRTPKAQGYSYSGHSSHVTRVKFTSDDNYLLSAGGKDATVLQWKVC